MYRASTLSYVANSGMPCGASSRCRPRCLHNVAAGAEISSVPGDRRASRDTETSREATLELIQHQRSLCSAVAGTDISQWHNRAGPGAPCSLRDGIMALWTNH